MSKDIFPKLAPLDIQRIPSFSIPVSWGITDPERFQRLMKEASSLVAPGVYFGDNLFTWMRNLSLFSDDAFVNAWRSNLANASDQAIAWRRYILACAAYHCVRLEGDFVECGVYTGTGIKTVMDYLGGPDFPRTFWGYDTYDYNPVEGHAFEGQQEGMYQKVCERFKGYEQVRLIQGLIPDSFEKGCPDKIAYLHIDLNHAEAEMVTLKHLFNRVVSGGMVILDDYEWSGIYRTQKAAEDPWFQDLGYRVMPLPTGQGLVFKR